MDDESPFLDHKLCGFFFAVLAVETPNSDIVLSRCQIFSDGHRIGFSAENGAVLLTPDCNNAVALQNGHIPAEKKKKKVGSGRKLRRIGLVNGSMSVVHQLHLLVKQKCLKIDARVVRLVTAENKEARAIVLVDVYLPAAVWSGWQFPKSSAIAGALFKHLSCNWGHRRSVLVDGGEYFEDVRGGSVWELSDCHVFNCKLHWGTPKSSRRRLFELHEIFKSVPSVSNKGKPGPSTVKPVAGCSSSGIWDITDDILADILGRLGPVDLLRIAATCHHLRSLAVSIMPCMKLKLFPHQQAAVEWMLQRERNAGVLQHPLYMEFSTEEGFSLFVNTVSGDIVTGRIPSINDFRGGMFCDEPGLGKTITALSLILKTQGTIADPPGGVHVVWCTHNGDPRCGYYDLKADNLTCNNITLGSRSVGKNGRRGHLSLDECTPTEYVKYPFPKRARLMDPGKQIEGSVKTPSATSSKPTTHVVRCTRRMDGIRKNLFPTNDRESGFRLPSTTKGKSTRMKRATGSGHVSQGNQVGLSSLMSKHSKRSRMATSGQFILNETWVQCDACHKWRKVAEASVGDASAAWFCSMNTDPAHQSCRDPEETWDNCQSITYLPGFHIKGTAGGEKQNISFFISVLKENHTSLNSITKKALVWLAKLTPEKLAEMETIGLVSPILGACADGDARGFPKLFEAFGLIRKVKRGISWWYYPRNIDNLAFDLAALRIALCEPLNSVRLYMSTATLIVVPSNLVDHWTTQIQKHVKNGQLRLFVWIDNKKPSAHNLAWDFDIVITTFSRLSAEWSPRKRSPMMQVHWLRVILDEGHTLGSSLALTNKLQMVVSLTASNRWLLTGTPTPNTPNSQLSHLHPMLKFLHDEAFGENHKSWETGILRPFEAELEEGRSRLLELLRRCMISARKTDLHNIPPCIKEVTFVNFTEEHARSYNELVETVQRNILMADWSDPSHVESLLNPKQWKFRSTLIRNLRLSCCVAGHIKVTEAGHDIQETMDILVENGLDATSEEYAFIKYNLLYGGYCRRCNEWCRLPIITPCRHLLCLGCVGLDSERCTFPACGYLYEMQTPEMLARPENPNPKWPVPKDLIELQPSYRQDDWNPDWRSTSSSKVAYLVERLKVLQEANREIVYHVDEDSGELLNQDWHRPKMDSCQALPQKVIIFSQFPEHRHVIEQQLTISGIKFAGMYSPMASNIKIKSLATFQHDASCLALVMDGSAALGLDLSFVTHVFLMEPIWDRSMEEQVISRAHRMGATRPIHVETLAMRGTIEEQMLEFLQDAEKCRRLMREELEQFDQDGARSHRSLHELAESNYLARLSFVKTNS